MIDELKIKEMIENGFAIRRISSLLKITENEIKNIVSINNWKLIKEEFSDDKIDHIKQLYTEGVSAKNLGIKYSIDKRRVQKWAKENNNLRNVNDSKRFTEFNQNIFDEMDSEGKAYWLGFFYADAYNNDRDNKFVMTLQHSDHDHLVKLANFVNLSSEKIKVSSVNRNYKLFLYSTIILYSKHLCETMIKFGCPRAKSFIIKYPDWLNEDLTIHFIRGMFDGDGSLTKRTTGEWKWSLATTKECGESIKNIIKQELNIDLYLDNISKQNHNTYELSVNGNDQVLKLSHWLYDNSSKEFRLDRKYDRMLELQEKQNNRKYLNSTIRDHYLLTSKEKLEILELISLGKSYKEIAEKFNINPITVKRIYDKSLDNKTA